MKLAIFTLNNQSLKVAKKIRDSSIYEVKIFQGKGEHNSFFELVANVYQKYEGLIFIMATGIVVRSLSPLLKNKSEDPAVLVIDPQGKFVISLLSGHLGGANKLTKEIAGILKAQPVITTATDVLGKRSIEEWSEYFNLKIINLDGLVKVNGALVRGEKINVFSQLKPEYFNNYPLAENDKVSFFPLNYLKQEIKPAGISISVSKNNLMNLTEKVDLKLVVKNLVVGIGCRQGISPDKLKKFLVEEFTKAGLNLANIKKIVSIELKKQEQGLIALAKELKVPLEFFSVKEIKECMEKYSYLSLSYSKFVEKTVGVGCVCEPVALLGSKEGILRVGKRSGEGMTLAVAEEKLPWWV